MSLAASKTTPGVLVKPWMYSMQCVAPRSLASASMRRRNAAASATSVAS